MTSAWFQSLVAFNENTKSSFLQHLRENPTCRRISQKDIEIRIEWLTNPHKQPSFVTEGVQSTDLCQKSFYLGRENAKSMQRIQSLSDRQVVRLRGGLRLQLRRTRGGFELDLEGSFFSPAHGAGRAEPPSKLRSMMKLPKIIRIKNSISERCMINSALDSLPH
ncbi:LOW QUALITY PROTEIN: hypothetical protein GX51_02961 [Blastomyces parvus]|uniref:Uncharacterized protein n=1 Tax=Blastomyces parvus TaxID=2060905 RepID=A0A2B7X9Q5_9EURO|nr:LOW QUALITY PROTEIN: hypothetical protein GX51_02961 [Blastomyces parvus]